MIELAEMTAAHVPAVARLEQCCFSDPWSEASVAAELDNPLSLWLVALADGRVVGYVGSQAVLDAADVMNVAVDCAFRRRGIARVLLTALVDRLAARGVSSLALEVRPSNGGALALYRSLGFSEAGRRPGYYRNPREDALILRKEWNV